MLQLSFLYRIKWNWMPTSHYFIIITAFPSPVNGQLHKHFKKFSSAVKFFLLVYSNFVETYTSFR